MAMKKYGSPEKFVTFTGPEVNVVDEAFKKTGKTAVSDFTEEELEVLQKELDAVQEKPAPRKKEKKSDS